MNALRLLHFILVFLELLAQSYDAVVNGRFIGYACFLRYEIFLRDVYGNFRDLVLLEIVLLMVKYHMAADDPRVKLQKVLHCVAGVLLNVVVVVGMA